MTGLMPISAHRLVRRGSEKEASVVGAQGGTRTHKLAHRNLNPACLPISPPGQGERIVGADAPTTNQRTRARQDSVAAYRQVASVDATRSARTNMMTGRSKSLDAIRMVFYLHVCLLCGSLAFAAGCAFPMQLITTSFHTNLIHFRNQNGKHSRIQRGLSSQRRSGIFCIHALLHLAAAFVCLLGGGIFLA